MGPSFSAGATLPPERRTSQQPLTSGTGPSGYSSQVDSGNAAAPYPSDRATVAHIEVSAVATADGVSATTISAIAVALIATIATFFIARAAEALSCRLILGRESA